MAAPKRPSLYYVAFFTTSYRSVAEAKTQEPELIAAHMARSRELHRGGSLVLAGAFLDHTQEHLETMAVFTTREAAEEYAKGDPFVLNGRVTSWAIREWANILD